MADAPLPELARSLRALGAAGSPAAESAYAAVLGPLLDARARAAAGDASEALSALRGGALAARIESRVAQIAGAGQPDAARARARAARARELLEPLQRELAALDRLATAVRRPDTSSPEWAAWIAALRRVFAAADEGCRALARLLDEPAERPPAGRRWFGRKRQ
jgi:hypothetical protein